MPSKSTKYKGLVILIFSITHLWPLFLFSIPLKAPKNLYEMGTFVKNPSQHITQVQRNAEVNYFLLTMMIANVKYSP